MGDFREKYGRKPHGYWLPGRFVPCARRTLRLSLAFVREAHHVVRGRLLIDLRRFDALELLPDLAAGDLDFLHVLVHLPDMVGELFYALAQTAQLDR